MHDPVEGAFKLSPNILAGIDVLRSVLDDISDHSDEISKFGVLLNNVSEALNFQV